MKDHRRHRLSVTPPSPSPFARLLPATPSAAATPSKLRRRPSSSATATASLLLLLSLRSLYSVLPFLRSSLSPSSPLLPFSFLVALLSSLLSLLLLPRPLPSLSLPYFPLLLKSLLLTSSLLLRFLSLRFLPAAPAILADLTGTLTARSLSLSLPRRRRLIPLSLLLAILALLSLTWDRSVLLPFLSGFLAFHDHSTAFWPSLRPIPRRHLHFLSLSLSAAILFLPASITIFITGVGAFPLGDLGWPLVNTVVFGVILSGGYGNGKEMSSFTLHREFLVTFFGTLVLERIYVVNMSLPGFLLCGLLMWVAVRELGRETDGYVEIGSGSEESYSAVMNPIRHILSERKSRKIALFLLINTGYMVVEFVVGFMSNSLGLISDACHMLFDCAALAIGLYASYISRLPANNQFNYGRGRFEVVSGYVNAVLLVLVGAMIVLESFERILDPQEISTSSLLAVSIGGLAVNMVGLVFFHEEHHHAHGGGACSHSHSQHSHHDHNHEHKIAHTEENSVGHPNSTAHSHGSSKEHSHSAHDLHVCNQDHHHHDHHDHKDDCRIDTDKHCHEHQHECHDKKHDHQEPQHRDCTKHEHQGIDIQSVTSPDHCSEGHTHHGCKHDKEPQLQSETPNHSHSQSSLSKAPNATENLRKHHHIDHNMEGIFLHVLADTMGSVGVVISTLLIKYKGWMVSDPACSIFISVMIVSSVLPLLRNSAEILLQRVPRHYEQDLKVALNDLMKVEGVCSIQNVHIWNLTNTEIVGTLHLHVSAETDKAFMKKRASALLLEAGIKDITIQVESVIL